MINKVKYTSILLFIFVFISGSYSQSPCDSIIASITTNIAANNTSTVTNSFKKSVVTKVTCQNDSKPEAGLGDYIKVEISNIEDFLKIYRSQDQKIVLYFDEVPMHGIYADFISTRDNSITFRLTRDTISQRSWNVFYRGQTYYKLSKKVAVSIGFENDGSLETKVKDFKLVLVVPWLLIFTYVVILALLVLFILLVKRTGIIRDDHTNEHHGTFSLSRSQLAFWTFIIVFSFLYVYAVTGEIATITNSTLILLTVSMTTTAGAKIIDSSKKPEHVEKNATSEEFFKDIISDNNGVSIHRFQMVAWTLILGAFFLRSVIMNLAMPEINDGMLVLMGISSGTYLGLKIPEKSTPTPPAEEPVPDTTALATEGTLLEEDESLHDTPAVG